MLEARHSLFSVLDAWGISSTYHVYVAQKILSLDSLLMLYMQTFSCTVHRYSILPINVGICTITHVQTFCGGDPTALWMKSLFFLPLLTAWTPFSLMLGVLFVLITQELHSQYLLNQSRTSLIDLIQGVRYVTIIYLVQNLRFFLFCKQTPGYSSRSISKPNNIATTGVTKKKRTKDTYICISVTLLGNTSARFALRLFSLRLWDM